MCHMIIAQGWTRILPKLAEFLWVDVSHDHCAKPDKNLAKVGRILEG